MKKKIGLLSTAIAVTVLAGSNVYAAGIQEQPIAAMNYQEITPLWSEITSIIPYISAEGTTLYPEVHVKAKNSSSKIVGTMYLEKYSSGKWTSVTSWSISGTGSVIVSKSYKGTSGVKYRTRVAVNINGENATGTSGSHEL